MSSSTLSVLVLLLAIHSGAAFKHCITSLCISFFILGLVCISERLISALTLAFVELFRPLNGFYCQLTAM